MNEFGGNDTQYDIPDTTDVSSEYSDNSGINSTADIPTDFPEDEPEQLHYGTDWSQSQAEILDGVIKSYQNSHPEMFRFNLDARNGADDISEDIVDAENYGDVAVEYTGETEMISEFPEDTETSDFSDAAVESAISDELQEDYEEAAVIDSGESDLTLDEDTGAELSSADETNTDEMQISDWEEGEAIDIEHGVEDAGDVPFAREEAETEKNAYDQLSQYMNKHNYGADDYAEYSQDPEWQRLHKIAFPDAEARELSQEAAYSQLSNYMNEHNYGADDYAEYSQDPEWRRLHEAAFPDAARAAAVTDIPNQSIDDVGGWLSDVNPKFDPWDVDSPYSSNCGSCALAVENRLNGNSDAVATDSTLSIEEMEQQTGMEQVSMQPDEIEQYLISQGPGSHAIIGIDRSEGPGHWFNAYYDGEKVYALDGQTGTTEGWPPDYGDVVNWDVSVKKGE